MCMYRLVRIHLQTDMLQVVAVGVRRLVLIDMPIYTHLNRYIQNIHISPCARSSRRRRRRTPARTSASRARALTAPARSASSTARAPPYRAPREYSRVPLGVLTEYPRTPEYPSEYYGTDKLGLRCRPCAPHRVPTRSTTEYPWEHYGPLGVLSGGSAWALVVSSLPRKFVRWGYCVYSQGVLLVPTWGYHMGELSTHLGYSEYSHGVLGA